MNGNRPYEKLKSLLPNIKEDMAIFPPFILDKIIPIYQHIPFAKKDKKIKMGKHLQPGHDLYVQYNSALLRPLKKWGYFLRVFWRDF